MVSLSAKPVTARDDSSFTAVPTDASWFVRNGQRWAAIVRLMNQSLVASSLNGSARIVGYRRVAGSTGINVANQVGTHLTALHNGSLPFTGLPAVRDTQPLGRSFVDPLGTARTTDMVKSLGGFVDLITGTGSAGTIRLVAGNRTTSTAVPGVVGNLAATICTSTINATWTTPAVAAGWYQWGRTSVPLASVSNFIPTGKSATTEGFVTMPAGQASYFHVSACSAAGCSTYQSIGPFSPSVNCP